MIEPSNSCCLFGIWRNIWKISVLWSLLKSDLTTKRVRVCTLLKVMVNCVVPSATHSGPAAAKMHTFTQ